MLSDVLSENQQHSNYFACSTKPGWFQPGWC